MQKNIAVIGAGVSGMSCAHRLKAEGIAVTIFDKGRALGGRLSTRQSEGWAFNHGAPYIHVESKAFDDFILQLATHGTARCVDAARRLYAGHPHMNELLTPLADDMVLHQSIEISRIEQSARGWHLRSKTEKEFEPFDAVLICIPAPQARRLIQSIAPDWAAQLDVVQYDPCLTMLLGLGEAYHGLYERRFENEPVVAEQIRQYGQEQTDKSAQEAWVVHATREWSANNIDLEREDIARIMFDQFLQANNLSAQEPVFLRGHRWRFARVAQAAGKPCFWDSQAKLGLAGDWCLGPNAEDAFTSGACLAERILQG